MEEIVEEPMMGASNANSINQTLFHGHHNPLDSIVSVQLGTGGAGQMDINSMLDGPGSGGSDRKTRSFLHGLDLVSAGGENFDNSHNLNIN